MFIYTVHTTNCVSFLGLFVCPFERIIEISPVSTNLLKSPVNGGYMNYSLIRRWKIILTSQSQIYATRKLYMFCEISMRLMNIIQQIFQSLTGLVRYSPVRRCIIVRVFQFIAVC
jgi:hypothetical protein